jgi:drug/metabolite transporter (DMT)-like permease
MNFLNTAKLFLLSAIWGGSFIFMNIAVKNFHFAVSNEIRLILSTLFVGIAGLLFKSYFIKKENLPYIITISMIGITVPSFLVFYSSSQIPIAIVIICSSLAPIWGIVLDSIDSKRLPGKLSLLGMLLCCVGVIIIIISEYPIKGPHFKFFPLFAVLAASLLYAINNFYISKKGTQTTPFENTFGTFLVSALVGLPILFFAPVDLSATMNGGLALVVLGAIGLLSVLGFQIIKDVGPVNSLLTYYLMPIFGLLWGYIFLEEAIHPQIFLGGVMVIGGLILVTHSKDLKPQGISPRVH